MKKEAFIQRKETCLCGTVCVHHKPYEAFINLCYCVGSDTSVEIFFSNIAQLQI